MAAAVLAACSGAGGDGDLGPDRAGGATLAPAEQSPDVDRGVAFATARAHAVAASQLFAAGDSAGASGHARASVRAALESEAGGALLRAASKLAKLSKGAGSPDRVRAAAGRVQALAEEGYADIEADASPGFGTGVVAGLATGAASAYADCLDGGRIADPGAYGAAHALQAEASRRFLALSEEARPSAVAEVQVGLGVLFRAAGSPRPPRKAEVGASEAGDAAAAIAAALGSA